MPAQQFSDVIRYVIRTGHKEVWDLIAPGGVLAPALPDETRSRDLFTYALLICEHEMLPWGAVTAAQDGAWGNNQKAAFSARLRPLLTLAAGLQVDSGNFRWTQGSKICRDPAAVDFAMRAGALLCARHRERLEAHGAWDSLVQIVEKAAPALRRNVPPRHTNIALMNATNLIMVGHCLSRPRQFEEGVRRLDNLSIYTAEWGIHEFSSSTYTGIQLSTLELLSRFARHIGDECLQDQAQKLANYTWKHVEKNWIPGANGRLGGSSSRVVSNYTKGEGRLDDTVWLTGLAAEPGPREFHQPEPDKALPLRLVYPALAHLAPPTRDPFFPPGLNQAARDAFLTTGGGFGNSFPNSGETTLERWGIGRDEVRAHHYLSKITLGTSSAAYDHPHRQDLPMTVDFADDRVGQNNQHPRLKDQEGKSYPTTYPNRCYVLSDNENDPYGKNDKHLKPLLWTAAQEQGDALGLVLYDAIPRRYLQTHFVCPVQNGDKLVFWNGQGNTADATFAYTVPPNGAAAPRRQGAVLKSVEYSYEARVHFYQQNQPLASDVTLDGPDPTLLLIRGSSAVGIRMVWGRNLKGRWPVVKLEYDSEAMIKDNPEPVTAVRLTVQHHLIREADEGQRANPWKNAGAAFWVRIAEKQGNESDTAFRNRMIQSMGSDKADIYSRSENPRIRQAEADVYERFGLQLWPDGNRATLPKEPTLSLGVFSPDGSRYVVTEMDPAPIRNVFAYGAQPLQQPRVGQRPFGRDDKQDSSDLDTVPAKYVLPVKAYRALIRDGLVRDRLTLERQPQARRLAAANTFWTSSEDQKYVVPSHSIGTDPRYVSVDQARVWDPMVVGTEPGPRGVRYAWMPESGRPRRSDVGNVLWRLDHPSYLTRPFYAWARVMSPARESGSFSVVLSELRNDQTRPVRLRSRPAHQIFEDRWAATWRFGKASTWRWVPLDLTEINVEHGAEKNCVESRYLQLQFFARRCGAKISHLFLTVDRDHLPSDEDVTDLRKKP